MEWITISNCVIANGQMSGFSGGGGGGGKGRRCGISSPWISFEHITVLLHARAIILVVKCTLEALNELGVRTGGNHASTTPYLLKFVVQLRVLANLFIGSEV